MMNSIKDNRRSKKMTKAYSVQIGVGAVDRAIQTNGAIGFTNELGLHHAWHSLRIINVADGTNEILNRTVAQRLLRGDIELEPAGRVPVPLAQKAPRRSVCPSAVRFDTRSGCDC